MLNLDTTTRDTGTTGAWDPTLPPWLLVVIAAVLIPAACLLSGLDAPAAARPLPAATKPAVRVLTARDGWDPIATYDPGDKRLTVALAHLPADALVCIGDQCRLPAEWAVAGQTADVIRFGAR